MADWTDKPVEFRRAAEMRYGEQVYEIDVPLDGVDFDSRPPCQMPSSVRSKPATRSSTPTPSRIRTPVLINARVTTRGNPSRSPPGEPEARARSPGGTAQGAPDLRRTAGSRRRCTRSERSRTARRWKVRRSSSRTRPPCFCARETRRRRRPNAGSTSASPCNDALHGTVVPRALRITVEALGGPSVPAKPHATNGTMARRRRMAASAPVLRDPGFCVRESKIHAAVPSACAVRVSIHRARRRQIRERARHGPARSHGN